MKTCVCLILIQFSLFFSVSGQKLIQGLVTDEAEPIVGAAVMCAAYDRGVVTGIDGSFVIEIPETDSSVELVVQSLGFVPATVLWQGEANLKIELRESVMAMDAVVITGTMQPTFVAKSPVKVEVVTSKHIAKFLPAASTGLVESISMVNGVQEVTACGVCYTNNISINGLPGPYTAVLVDGSPMFGNLASVYGLNGIPSMMVDRFEVIKGPSSTLYGSEAVAGVINIITKSPEEQDVFSVDVMGTSHLETFGNLGSGFSTSFADAFVGINYAYINDFDDRNDDGFGDVANLDRVSLFTKWNIRRKSSKPFTVAAKYYLEDRRNGVEEFLKDRNYRELRGNDAIYGESIYTKRFEIFGTYELPLKPQIKMDYSFSNHHQNSYYGADQYIADQRIAYLNTVYFKNVGSHQLVSGVTLRYQFYDDNTVATEKLQNGEVLNHAERQMINGLFVQDEWDFAPKFTSLVGLRADYYQSHGLIFSPRANLKYKPSDWTTMRLNFGTGFRVVNLFTEDHAFISGQREVVISEELKPERSVNIAYNINHLFTFRNSQGSFDVDFYYTHFNNKIIPDYSQVGQIIYANTSGYAVSRGVSITYNHEFSIPLSVSLSGNLQDVWEKEEDESGVMNRRKIEFSNVWSGIVNVNYSLKKIKTDLAFTSNVKGPMAMPEIYDYDAKGEPTGLRPTSSPVFAVSNFQVTKSFNKAVAVYAGVQNMFDNIQQYSPLSGYNIQTAPVGFAEQFDTSYNYGSVHGREFYLGVKWQLL